MDLGKGFSFPQDTEISVAASYTGNGIPFETGTQHSAQYRHYGLTLNQLAGQVRRIKIPEVMAGLGYQQEAQTYTPAPNLNGPGKFSRNGGISFRAEADTHTLNNDTDHWDSSWSEILQMIKAQPETCINNGMTDRIINTNDHVSSNSSSGGDSTRKRLHRTSLMQISESYQTESLQQRNFNSIPQMLHDGFSSCHQARYSMKSPPRTDEFSSNIANSYPFAPSTPQQTLKLGNQAYTMMVNPSILKCLTQNNAEQNTLVIPTGKEDTRTPFVELIESVVDFPSAAAIVTTLKVTNELKGDSDHIDLNKTPPLKPPKRKKHRPKVVIEDKPTRKKKPMSPKNADTDGKKVRKRKYVHKNGPKSTCSPQPDVVHGNRNPRAEVRSKSCRKSLNFDMDNEIMADNMEMLIQQNNHILPREVLRISNSEKEHFLVNCYMSKVNSSPQMDQVNRSVKTSKEIVTLLRPRETIEQMSTDKEPLPAQQMFTAASTMKDLQTRKAHVTVTGKDALNVGRGSMKYHCISANQPTDAGQQQVVFHKRTTQRNLERIREQIFQSAAHNMQGKVPASSYSSGSKREHSKCILPHMVDKLGSALIEHDILSMNEQCNENNSRGESHPRVSKKCRVDKGYCHTAASTIQSCKSTESSRNIFSKSQGCPALRNHFAQVQGLLNSDSQNNSLGISDLMSKQKNYYGSPLGSYQKHHMPSDMLSQMQKTHNGGNILDLPDEIVSSIIAEKKSKLKQFTVNNTTEIYSGDRHRTSSPNTQANASAKNQNDKTITPECQTYQTGWECKQRKMILVDEIIHKLESLNLGAPNGAKLRHEERAVVVYNGNGTIVPNENTDPLKRRKQRPKVDLDPDTNRLWKLLMVKEGKEEEIEVDEDKVKWWEAERNTFQGRADSFIARMHLVQGDRRFSRWKGSVVDSVIGVFLTQNVTDHISSSAFISLAARFPVQLRNQDTAFLTEGGSIFSGETKISNNNDGSTRWQKELTTQTIYSVNPSLTFNQRSNLSSPKRRQNTAEENRWPLEEVVSSHDSTGYPIVQAPGVMESSVQHDSKGYYANDGHESMNTYAPTFSILQEIENFMFSDFPSEGPGTTLAKETSISEKQQRTIGKFEQSLQLDSSYNREPYHFDLNRPTTADSELFEVDGSGMFTKEPATLPSSFLWNNTLQKMRTPIKKIADRVESRTLLQSTRQIWDEETPRAFQNALNSRLPYDLRSSLQEGLEGHQQQNAINKRPMPCHFTSLSSLDSLPRQLKTAQSIPFLHNFGTALDVERSTNVADKECTRNQIPKSYEDRMSSSNVTSSSTHSTGLRANDENFDGKKKNSFDWDSLRRQVHVQGEKKDRTEATMDSMDYEAVRSADVNEISKVIKDRGMNNMLAARIKGFLNRLVAEHGSIDLEWLRDVPADKAKDYLLSIKGLGLKSAECVRLLTLHHLAFPVDTNVGRIAVRLGWVPLRPLPESLQLHLLEMYPMLESIQKYLWPRLCKLDQRTLYELHYQLITFGKVFCTKSKPNCNACPMRGECKHFASAYASARLALPSPDEKSTVTSTAPNKANMLPLIAINPISVQPLENLPFSEGSSDLGYKYCEPIVEEPATPELENPKIAEIDIEDTFDDDAEEIPTIKLNVEAFTLNLQNFMQENMELQEGDLSKALVALTPEAACIPTSRLKNVSRLRTEHQVYELPDSHPLLKELEKREPDDPSPYLLAIWTPGETANSTQSPRPSCGYQDSRELCSATTCFSCNCIRESNLQIVRGTILIPCRTAMRGSFPLNGTYFQVNEMFADHDSSLKPIDVPRAWIWNLPKRTVYFGTSVTTIFKGMATEDIQYCFWRGFVCVRGFDRKTRVPRPLIARLHFPASKTEKSKKVGTDKSEIK